MLKSNLPVLILDSKVLFPFAELKLDIDNSIDKKIISLAENYYNNYIFVLCTDRDIVSENKFPALGIVAQIKNRLDMPNNGNIKITLKGISRGVSSNYHVDDGMYDAVVSNIELEKIDPLEDIAYSKKLKEKFIDFLDNKKSLGNSIINTIDDINDSNKLTDIISDFLDLDFNHKLKLFEEINPLKRVELLLDDLSFELSLLEYDNYLDDRIEYNLDESQKKFYLQEKLRQINEELGVSENPEYDRLMDKLEKLDAPDHIINRLQEEINRYKLCNSNSPETGILRNYIDTLLSLPWNKVTKDNNDIADIKNVLDSSHYGLSEAKNRIVEYMATKKYTKSKNNPIICLVGPPGIGKTSLAKAIAKSLKRKCVKISVGGINDEAEITGHRRAYVGAAPGKIITGIKKAGVSNPVFIIDEIDKMTKDIKGDPASSLLEILDKEQNDKFIDHFIEEEFDLSKVMFILTANYIDKIPLELKDRLEIIELPSYTILEKLNIVKKYIFKKMEVEFKLTNDELKLTDETILKIIKNYTKESGVRELERIIRKLCRKYICTKLIESFEIDLNNELEKILGHAKYVNQDNYSNTVGMVNALSYNPLGGQVVKIETIKYPGTGKINYSKSQLGELMQDSMELSFNYIKGHAEELNIDFNILINNDFYVNLPGSSNKKDGPSAGVNIITSIVSLLNNKIIPNNISMTGEITLSGKILGVGGLKEKLIAALANNIDTIYIPLANKNDVLDLNEDYSDKIKIKFADNYIDIYKDLFKNI